MNFARAYATRCGVISKRMRCLLLFACTSCTMRSSLLETAAGSRRFDLAKLLSRFGYRITRQKGSHLRLTSKMRGFDHHVTIPDHDHLKLGTLNSVLGEVAGYIGISRAELERALFER